MPGAGAPPVDRGLGHPPRGDLPAGWGAHEHPPGAATLPSGVGCREQRSRDPARRAQISSEASFAVQSGDLQTQINDNVTADEFRANQAVDENPLEDAIGAGANLAYQLQDIQDLSLPIGWTFYKVSDSARDSIAASDPNNLWNYLPENNPEGWLALLAAKLLGIAATVIAAAQGAPFWFGIVNRILRR